MTRVFKFGVSTAMALFVSAFAGTSYAQKPSINLNLATPGARANAMGGAFIGVADDATAAVTNPAGLVSLTSPQVYAELTSRSFEPFIEDKVRLNALSFLAFSTPINSRVAVGVMRNQFLEYTDTGTYQAKGSSIGGSISASVTPTVRLGMTISGERVHQTDFCDPTCTSWGLGLVLGGLWRPTEQVSVGMMFTKGASHEEVPFTNPNRIGGGVAYRPISSLLVSADALWINTAAIFPDSELSNVGEFHAGGEYLLIGGTNQLFVRAGGYFSSKESEPDPDIPSIPGHAGSIGVGITLGQRFQTDFAYVTSSKAVILSGAVRLK